MQGGDLEKYNDDAFKNYNEKVLEPCPNCGRTFLPDRLVVHMRSCKSATGSASLSPQKMGGAGKGADLNPSRLS